MRATILALSLTLGLPAAAETLSAELARSGIAATEQRLAALTAPTAEDGFALGATRFLRTVEQSYQLRWQHGLTDPTGALPFLRLPVADNPARPPFDPAVFRQLFTATSEGMTRAADDLSALPQDADFAVEIALADLWFDVDANGARTPGEGMAEMLGPALLGWRWQDRDPAAPFPTVRFDSADAAWLAAYAHLLAGLSDVILAYDPSGPVEKIMSARAAMEAIAPLDPDLLMGQAQVPDTLDILAILIEVLDQEPDDARLLAAQSHLLAMVDQNRRFWALVERETDNDREWLPNARQQSVLGVTLPPETGTVWMAVLDDLQAVLKGEKLVPYWRFGGQGGVNVGRMFTDPGRIDLAGWIHGWAALPYLESGPIIGFESWQAFEGIMSGDPMLMALWLN